MAQFFPCNRPAVIVPSIIVAGLLVAGLWGGTRAPGDDAHADVRMLQLDTAPLACLPPAAVRQIKQKLDDIEPAYQACRDEIEKRTKGMGLDDKGLRVVFATITAHASAEYGSTPAYNLPDLLKADGLMSTGYLLLLGHYLHALRIPSESMRIIGFQGGKIGNYAQGMITVNKTSLLLDPTVGLVAQVGFNDLLSGRRLKAEQIVAAYMHASPNLRGTLSSISHAVFDGQYRPSDLLYYFASPNHYLGFNGVAPPGSKPLPSNLMRYPTPGGVSLARQRQKTQ
ncbi:hypothetical protein [Bordetella bronchiseptica]|uniref:hypothetical protein n=1 Tax=Bordetella bronchiseptica TaxID=518 RepID=UPI00045B70DF|nr:hypothetical protein [Bordetella bronchiseptica]KAK51570.1 hypothetical protein L576_0144 [Bordetella bronchiseptica OSU054]KDB78777.1 hypothetical protein L494_0121 [Bordetella bronchiseptica CA90 BB1334]KDD43516.1 hypothetical protein L532_0062 [Bordetella bronchiseptica OSU095]KDD58728.1 hypothetical protein L533_5582 [Bordetella bronchiseptica OSU553]